jgi:hypothetical protein
LKSGRRPVVKIIAESLSQHDEKRVVDKGRKKKKKMIGTNNYSRNSLHHKLRSPNRNWQLLAITKMAEYDNPSHVASFITIARTHLFRTVHSLGYPSDPPRPT